MLANQLLVASLTDWDDYAAERRCRPRGPDSGCGGDDTTTFGKRIIVDAMQPIDAVAATLEGVMDRVAA